MRRKHTARPGGSQASDIATSPAEALSPTVQSLLAEAQALSTRLAALNEVAVAMQRSTDTRAMLQVMANQARWVIDFQLCVLVERDGVGYRYHVLRSSQPLQEPTRAFHRHAIDQVLRHGHALVVDDLASEDDAPPGMHSAMLLPLYDYDQVIGTLNFYTGASRRYSQDDMRVATALAMQVGVILRKARLFAAIRRARDELHTVLESISDGVLVIDQRGRLTLINHAMRALIGQPTAEVDGRRLLWLLRAPGADGTRLLSRATLRRVLAGFQQHADQATRLATAPQPLNGTLVLTDGRHLAWVCAPLVALGPSEGYVVTVRDVSARVALEQLREDMTQMLVHDLRTPLATIIMGLDLLPLDQQLGDPQAQAKTFERTQRAARGLLSQVNLLLEVSKLEAGRMELEQEVCGLPALAQAAISTVEVIADSKRQRLVLALGNDLPELLADSGLLRRVLENLLSNACKFAPSGSDIVLGAHYERQQQQIEIWVQDAGPGVPFDMREHVFEKYGQVRATAREGTGIGLTFCRLVVEAHGGSIGVRDAPGGGSVFWFQLPLTAS
jgi:two-component system, NtrC family, sensor histidine kinase KinB